MKFFSKILLLSLALPFAVSMSSCASRQVEEPEPVMEPAPISDYEAPPMDPAPMEVDTPEPAYVEPVSLEPIYFDFDSFSIRFDQHDKLRRLAEAIRTNGAMRIQIEGHADERGSNEYNLALGERRAQAVKQFLIGEGISADDLSTISYGEERPAVSGSGEDAWQQNRRSEFTRM